MFGLVDPLRSLYLLDLSIVALMLDFALRLNPPAVMTWRASFYAGVIDSRGVPDWQETEPLTGFDAVVLVYSLFYHQVRIKNRLLPHGESSNPSSR